MKYMFRKAFIACLCKDTNEGVISCGQIICVKVSENKVYDLGENKIYDYQPSLKRHYRRIEKTDDNPIYAIPLGNLDNPHIWNNKMLVVEIIKYNRRGLSILLPDCKTMLYETLESVDDKKDEILFKGKGRN